jgi:N-acetylneuraminic acid mutarotase
MSYRVRTIVPIKREGKNLSAGNYSIEKKNTLTTQFSWEALMQTHISRLFLLVMGAQVCFAQGPWTQIGDMPEIRYGHTVNELNGKIYVVGGAKTEGGVFPRTALVYDTSSGIWTQIPLYNNQIRAAHGSCVVGGRLYVMGGNDSSSTVSTMDMFDPHSGQWVSKNSMSTDRGLAACVSMEGKIYVIGGLHSYDVSGLRRAIVNSCVKYI